MTRQHLRQSALERVVLREGAWFDVPGSALRQDGKIYPLAALEHLLLLDLAEHRGTQRAMADLLLSVWGDDREPEFGPHTVRCLGTRLRRRLAMVGCRDLIPNSRGKSGLMLLAQNRDD